MTHANHKIEININEIVNVDETKEETNREIKMSSAHATNHIVSSTIHVTQASKAPTPTPTTECQICFEKYNKSNHAPIKCTSCDFEACRQCHATFILDPSNVTPNCMNCHRELQREFLVEKFTQKFVTQDWKKHREQIIFQRERALLPTRQPVAEMVRRKDALRRENEDLLKQMNELRTKQYQCQREIGNIYYKEDTYIEDAHLAGLIYGEYITNNWQKGKVLADFYLLKGMIETLLNYLGLKYISRN
jgi:hypothetical protein